MRRRAARTAGHKARLFSFAPSFADAGMYWTVDEIVAHHLEQHFFEDADQVQMNEHAKQLLLPNFLLVLICQLDLLPDGHGL